ncbi:MAG: SUMF1/EgtB/PvdO family nonheme iron enzyme [Caldilineaceae bacterium]
MNYLDFDLQIEASGDGNQYRARVLASPAGEAESLFTLPFDEKDLYIFVLSVGQTRIGVRRLGSPQMRLVTELGSQLYQAVFQDQVQSCFLRSLDEAEKRGAGLRLRLRLDSTLINLPWEFLYDTTHRRFLSHSNRTPIVRFLELPQPSRALPVTLPLKVLVVIASPCDYTPLNVEQEWSKVKGAVKELEERGLLQLTRLEQGTLSALRRKLLKEQFHILHFIGHGAYDAERQAGVILLEDENGRARRISGTHLGMLLHDHASLRLLLLNACEGARTAVTDLFAGVAQYLVLQGVPAVIAMQFEITDQAAITLAQAFYEALLMGTSVDVALAEARKAIFAEGNDVEWGTPVLYMRANDGRLFDLARESKVKNRLQKAMRRTQSEMYRLIPTSEFRLPHVTLYVRVAMMFSLLLLLLTGWLASPTWQRSSSLPHLSIPATSVVFTTNLSLPTRSPTPPTFTVTAVLATPTPQQTDTPPPGLTATKQAIATATIAPTNTWTQSSTPTATPTPTASDTATPRPTLTPTSYSTWTPTAQPLVIQPVQPTATFAKQPTPAVTVALSKLTSPAENVQIGTTWREPQSGLLFVFVPAGEFLMGSSNADLDASDDEKPAHMNKTAAYWLSQTEITNATYRPFVGGDGYNNRAYWTAAGWAWRNRTQVTQPGCWSDSELNQADQPVVCISWYEAMAFSAWLATHSGLDIRLPTEVQWEKGARGENGLLYPWGNSFDSNKANYCDLNCPYGWKAMDGNDGFSKSAPVGHYPTNSSPYGALDMAGNVSEWMYTLFRAYPYKSDDRREDVEAEGSRVTRGGSWSNRSLFVRSADRFKAEPSDRNDNLGFRLVVLIP